MNRYWLALGGINETLDYCQANDENEALWKFGQMGLYPNSAVEVPQQLLLDYYDKELEKDWYDDGYEG